MAQTPAPPLALTSVPNCMSPLLSPIVAFPARRRYLTPTAVQPMGQPMPAVVCNAPPPPVPLPLIETYPAPATCLPARSNDAPLAIVATTEPAGTPSEV